MQPRPQREKTSNVAIRRAVVSSWSILGFSFTTTAQRHKDKSLSACCTSMARVSTNPPRQQGIPNAGITNPPR
jgi:hypothetical protein